MILSTYAETWILPLQWDKRPLLPLGRFQAELALKIVFIVAGQASHRAAQNGRARRHREGAEHALGPGGSCDGPAGDMSGIHIS